MAQTPGPLTLPSIPASAAVRQRRFWVAGAAAWTTAMAVGWVFIRSAAPTYDEPVHLVSGYYGLTRAIRPLNYRDHPPLEEMWDALPLLWLKPSSLAADPSWGRLYHFADAFLYKNRLPAERLLNVSRLWSLGSWTALLLAVLLAWSWRLAGFRAAASAAVLCAFCPAWVANAGLVTTDAGAAVLFFATCWLLSRRPRSRLRWAAAGVAMGAALAAKFSMIVLPPLALATWLTERRLLKERGPIPWKGSTMMAASALAVLAAVFRADLGAYWAGLSQTLGRLDQGRSAFLCGQYSTTGWLWYFPFALAVKTPLPMLLAGAGGLALWAAGPSVELVWATLPPAGLLLSACLSRTQIGYRHVLPLYPFLMLAGGCAGGWALKTAVRGRVLAAFLGLWLAAGTLRAAPDLLAYFNEPAGGAEGGWRLLADSNLDWGQGLKPLAEELARRGNPPVFLSYFGVADPQAYGIRYVPVAWVTNVERPQPSVTLPAEGPVWLAVSQTNLQAVYYQDKAAFDWLRKRQPLFTAGRSIFVYDLTGDDEGRRRLAGLLAGAGSAELARAVLPPLAGSSAP